MAVQKNNLKPEYKMINSKFIFSDPTYQRQLDITRVKRIVSNFNQNLVNPIKVSQRKDGFYYVFDGQHTLAALKLKNNNKDLPVACKVYKGLTKEDEARLFAEQNGISRAVDIHSKMRALYEAGDAEIIELHDTINNMGIKFDFTKTSEDNKIVAYATVLSLFRSCSLTEFKTVIRIIKESWNGDSLSYSKDMLQGVYLFYRTYKNEVDIKDMITQFSKQSAKYVLTNGKIYQARGAKKYAIILVDVYNYNKRILNRIDPTKIR